MDVLREYLLSVIAAALVCSLLLALMQNTGAEPLLRVICGIFVTVTVLTFVHEIQFSSILPAVSDFSRQASEAAQSGIQQAEKSLVQRIKQDSETYILDKAREQGFTIQAEVSVSTGEIPVPESVTIYADLTEYEKERLAGMITEELGISREEQLWIGSK